MSNLIETFPSVSVGLGHPNPYPYGIPEELPTSANTSALANSLVAFTGQGRLLGFTVSSTRGSGQFIQLFDLAALPASGAVPIISIDIATVTAKGIAFDPYGRWMKLGCVIVNSTTQGSFTAGSADCLIDVQYIPQVI